MQCLMHPYPYPAADRIVRLTVDSVAGSGDPVYLNGAEIQTLRQSPVVESVLAIEQQRSDADRAGSSEKVHAVSFISNNFRNSLPAFYADFSDALPIDPPVEDVSSRFWQNHSLCNP